MVQGKGNCESFLDSFYLLEETALLTFTHFMLIAHLHHILENEQLTSVRQLCDLETNPSLDLIVRQRKSRF